MDTPNDTPQPAEAPVAEVLTPPTAPAAPPKPARQPKAEKSASQEAIWAVGRRKESIARVRLLPGTGTITVNKQAYDRYFPREILRLAVRQPLLVTHQLGKCNIMANVSGGGLTGQAGAVKLGIARALLELDPALRSTLRGAGLLTRDPRAKERKKYGHKGARKRFQWTKR